MYFIINLAFLLFFLFIALKIFSLFKKIFDLVISTAEKNDYSAAFNNSAERENNGDQLIKEELELQDMVEADSNLNDYNSSKAGSDNAQTAADPNSTADLKDNANRSAGDHLPAADDFAGANNVFSQFSSYSEAEKAVLYSEIISAPRSKRNNFY